VRSELELEGDKPRTHEAILDDKPELSNDANPLRSSVPSVPIIKPELEGQNYHASAYEVEAVERAELEDRGRPAEEPVELQTHIMPRKPVASMAGPVSHQEPLPRSKFSDNPPWRQEEEVIMGMGNETGRVMTEEEMRWEEEERRLDVEIEEAERVRRLKKEREAVRLRLSQIRERNKGEGSGDNTPSENQ